MSSDPLEQGVPFCTIVREALTKPWRTYVSGTDREDDQVQLLSQALKDTLRKELLIQEQGN